MSIGQSDQELLYRANKLQQEAERIIKELGIFPILEKISEPALVGSVKSGLMVWPDIDIQAYMPKLELDKVLTLLNEFAMIPTIQKVQFSNYRELRRDQLKSRINFPHGYYIGLRSLQPSGEWKFDIWFGEKGTLLNNYKLLEPSDITKKQRIVILKLKNEWLNGSGGYKNEIISTDFYKAVLDCGVKNSEEFNSYLKDKI